MTPSNNSGNSTIERAAAALPANLDGLRELSIKVESVFIYRALACSCGGDGTVLATPSGNDELPFLDPISFSCTACGKSTVFFDSQRDGYDGRLNGGACYEQGTAPQIIPCESCSGSAMALECGLAYNTDFEEEGDIELLDQAPDLFDSIDVNVRCKNCGSVQHVGAWELA